MTETTSPHPLVLTISEVIEVYPDGHFDFIDGGLHTVETALDAYLDLDDELIDAVDAVLAVAHDLELEHDAKAVAEQLVALVDRPEILKPLATLVDQRNTNDTTAEDVAKTAQEFQKFTGQNPKPSAAEPESKAGKLRLHDLNFPKRL